jgi:hypothetical protein
LEVAANSDGAVVKFSRLKSRQQIHFGPVGVFKVLVGGCLFVRGGEQIGTVSKGGYTFLSYKPKQKVKKRSKKLRIF